ncbi:Histone-lysine N-methyltransferase NSD2-like protein [Daphnia magna]|uniref:Histone-lysine N-methyltransferase NSD2-like protein n=1 Tax=Daphnia magna TaxID=35525 RepID=A0A164ZN15_9CRUS|nr:Histone-lysine N-methyltransferase NSD2-like protein [Daphnia magna]
MKKVRFAYEVEDISTESLSDLMMFVAAEIPRKFSGRGAVKFNRCAHPGKEWMMPSAVVQIEKGKLKIPIFNLQSSPLQVKRRDLITTIDIDLEAEVVMETKEADSPVSCMATADESMLKPCPSWVEKLRFGEDLSEEEKINLLAVIKRRWRCFPGKDGQIGKTDQAEHLIDTSDAQKVRSAPYRVSRYEREIVVDEVAKMLRSGTIRPSLSPWASPVVFVRKKDGGHRFCIDYRRLNLVTNRDVYPLPLIDDVLDRLSGTKFFSSFDLASGYWQVPVAEKDQCKTAFITPDGLYEFCHLPFGLNNGPAIFQRLMDKVLSRLKWHMCFVYLDDVLVFGKNFQEHQERLELVLMALEKASLTLNVEKSVFATSRAFRCKIITRLFRLGFL